MDASNKKDTRENDPLTRKMSQLPRREYLVHMRGRSQRRSRAERLPLLAEFCGVTGYERKYAIKLRCGKRPGHDRQRAEDLRIVSLMAHGRKRQPSYRPSQALH